jgi:hypothetical protein
MTTYSVDRVGDYIYITISTETAGKLQIAKRHVNNRDKQWMCLEGWIVKAVGGELNISFSEKIHANGMEESIKKMMAHSPGL